MEKKHPTSEDWNRMHEETKPGETRFFPEHETTIHKPEKELPVGNQPDLANYEPEHPAQSLTSKDYNKYFKDKKND